LNCGITKAKHLRLTAHQQQVIKQVAQDAFRAGARLHLFGSRIDDTQRRGDIDLLITTSLADPERIVRAEIDFQVQVQRALGEQRIDVLVDDPSQRVRPPIFDVAARTGVPL